MLEHLNLEIFVDQWEECHRLFIRSMTSSALAVLMLGLENFHQVPTDAFATELSEIVPRPVQLLFVRVYSR